MQIFPGQGVSALGRRYFAPYSSQPKRPLVLNVFRLNWFVFVPEMKYGRDHDADAEAAEKEPAISGQPDQQDEDERRRNKQTGSAAQPASGGFGLRIPFHTNTLPAFYLKMARTRIGASSGGVSFASCKGDPPGQQKSPLARALLEKVLSIY